MRKNHAHKRYAAIFFAIIMIQSFNMAFPVFAAESPADSKVNAVDNELSSSSTQAFEEIVTHASDFYFPVSSSSMLTQSNDPDSDNGGSEFGNQSPKGAYYYNYDYSLAVYLEKYALTPGESVSIFIRYALGFDPMVNSYLSINVYEGFYRDWYGYIPEYYGVSEPLLTFEVPTNTKGEIIKDFSIPSSSGLYTIQVQTDEGIYEYVDITIGNTGIFSKGSYYFQTGQDYITAVQLVDIADFSPLADTSYTYQFDAFDWETSQWYEVLSGEGLSDENGYSLIQETIPTDFSDYTVRLTIHAADAKYHSFLYKSWEYYYFARWGGQQATNDDLYQFVVTTDKTIYTPGDTMQLRALVLQYSFMNQTKTLQPFTPVSVTVYNPEGYALYWTTITTNEFGVLEYSLAFDADAELGTYGIEFGLGEVSYQYTFSVEYYTKPVFRVAIDTNGVDYFPENYEMENISKENLFSGAVHAEYYFGQPVIGATVTLNLKNCIGETLYTISGITNANGDFEFEIDLFDYEGLEFTFYAETEVVDEYGRKASSERQFSRWKELYVWGYLTSWDPVPGESLYYRFSAYQYTFNPNGDKDYPYSYWNWEYNPLVNVSATIQIYGYTDYYYYITELGEETLLQSHDALTNNFGAGEISFELELDDIIPYNLFEIRTTILLEDGRNASSSYYYRYRKYQLELNIPETPINPGDTFEFSATYKDVFADTNAQGQGRIYLYDATHQQLVRASIQMDGLEEFSLDLPNFAPEGEYYLYTYVYSESDSYYSGFEYHSAYASFTVGESPSAVFTLDHNATDATYSWNPAEIAIGDTLHLEGIANVSTNLPVYLEIYKRGLFFSLPLEIVGAEYSYNLPITADLGTDFTVMIYTIDDKGQLYEINQLFHVNYESGLVLTTDKEIYEPGDTMNLTLSPLTDQPTLVSLSFIDSSVLDVQPEDDSELAYFTESSYYAFIYSQSSWGTGYSARSYWWFGYSSFRGGYMPVDDGEWGGGMEDDYTPASNERINDKSGAGAPSFASLMAEFGTEIRDNVSESSNWIPRLIITENTTLQFKLPDNIGEWTIRVVSNGLDDQNTNSVLWGSVDSVQVKSFLPFFVDFQLPNPMYQDDIVSIKAYIYNYLGEDVTSNVAIHANNLLILNNPVQTVFVPNNYVSEVEFTVYCQDPYADEITILATASGSDFNASDGKLLPGYIHPKGIEIASREFGFLSETENTTQFTFSVDPNAMDIDTSIAFHTQYIDISLDGWQNLVGYPYGCVEQTMSKLIPTAMLYEYLNGSEDFDTNLRAQMEQWIFQGLTRIYSFQNLDGGWGWWYHEGSSQLQMTATVINGLLQLQNMGFCINDAILTAGIEFVLDAQESTGSWLFEYYSMSEIEATAYLVRTLQFVSVLSSDMNSAVQAGLDRIESLWQDDSLRSSFGASLYYLALHMGSFSDATIEATLISYLKSSRVSENGMIYWDKPSSSWYWYNLGGSVEVTAYSIQALAEADYMGNLPLIQDAMRFLMERRDQWGWWGTADTSAAISTFIALQNLETAMEPLNFTGDINIYVNDEFISTMEIDASIHQPTDILTYLDTYLDSGENEITLEIDGTGQLSYFIEVQQILRYDPEFELVAEVTDTDAIVTINLNELPESMSLSNVVVDMSEIPEKYQVSDENYEKQFETLTMDESIEFQIDLRNEKSIEIGQIRVTGTVNYNPEGGSDFTETNYQRFYWTSLPVSIQETGDLIVDTNLAFTSHSSNNRIQSIDSGVLGPRASDESVEEAEGFILKKVIDIPETLQPGEVLEVSIELENTGTARQYLALDDTIPSGSTLLEDTIVIGGSLDSDAITWETSNNQLHLFFSSMEDDTVTISYSIQLETLKSSEIPGSRLWAMYDELELETDAFILNKLEKIYTESNTLFQDTEIPEIGSFKSQQVSGSHSQPAVEFTIETSDNVGIDKVKIVYKIDNVWQSRTFFVESTEDQIEIVLEDISIGDYELEYIIEVWDEYGNIATEREGSLIIYDIQIPYAIMGGLIGIAVGVAIIAFYVSKNQFEPKEIPVKTSFLDEK